MATFLSAGRCSLLWCAQKSNSPELGSRTRTYACAPHRSHRSRAVSGLVGAIAPVTSPSSSRASGCCVRLAPVWLGCPVESPFPSNGPGGRVRGGQLPYSTAQHIPRRQASRGRAVYATSENRTSHAPRPGRASAVIGDHTTVRVVTGENPCGSSDVYPPTCAMNTFGRKYPGPYRLVTRAGAGVAGITRPAPVRFAHDFEVYGRNRSNNRSAAQARKDGANRRGDARTAGAGRYPSSVRQAERAA